MRRSIPLVAAAVLAGCGSSRTPVPDVSHAVAPVGSKGYSLAQGAVHFTAPENWDALPPQGTLVGGVRSRTATVAVWRYARTEPLPRGKAELKDARTRLEADVQQRDPTFRVHQTRLKKRGIVLVGSQTIHGVPVDVRSTHLFKHGVETVVDAYAPPGDFPRVDQQVFVPLLHTLKVRKH